MNPFLFTVSWDRPLAVPLNFYLAEHRPADSAWDIPRDPERPYDHPDWTQNIPAQGAVTVCLVPEAFGLPSARDAALALVAGLGGLDGQGPCLAQTLVLQYGPGQALLDVARQGHPQLSALVSGAWNDEVRTTRAATVWSGADATPHGISQQGDTLVGTGALAGTWSLKGFFAPSKNGTWAHMENEAARRTNLTEILCFGGVALAMGVLWGWVDGQRLTDVALDGQPFLDSAQGLQALVEGVLTKHRFGGPGVVPSDARVITLEGNKAIHLARLFQHRTRVASTKGRTELAKDLVQSLLGALRSSGNLVVDQAPCPTHWVLHRTMVDILEGRTWAEIRRDMASAFDAGRAIGAEVPPGATNALLLAARSRGWV